MDTTAAIVAYLRSRPALEALVGDRIYSRPPPDVQLPLVYVWPLPGAPRQVIQQGDPINEPRFKVRAVIGHDGPPDFTPDADTTVAIADELRAAALEAGGTTVNGVRIDRALVEQEVAFEDEETHNAQVEFHLALRLRLA